jgi:predicted TIM-barrel fold metal-dependent hydrolase
MVRFAGDDRFFIGSDYPHAEGFIHPIRTTREALADLPATSIEKILCGNAASFYRI